METCVSYWNAKRKPRLMSTSSQGSESSTQSIVLDNEKGSDEVDIECRDNNEIVRGHIVWAGLEPLEFISLFPDWVRRSDVAEINLRVSI